MPPTTKTSDIYLRPAALLQHLIRFDTTNPPGNEAACIAYINGLLTEAGIETTVKARDPNRPNLVARLKGRGEAAPLLLQGHVDVVTTANQDWQHPPFGGELIDGCVWGRGALDMKGAVAMMVSALLRAKAEGMSPPGDVLLAVLSDEEAGGDYGAKWLAAQHPELFEGVKYSLGEFGGFSMYIQGHKFYPIQVAEKQMCQMRAIVRGPGGHGSGIHHGTAMAKLGRMLTKMDTSRLPVHITPVVRDMVQGFASALPAPLDGMVLGLLDPDKTDVILDQLGPLGEALEPALHNTANATIVHGGEKVNVIPSEIVVDIDGRLLPSFTPSDMLAELGALLGDQVELQVVRFDRYPTEIDMGLFDTLAGVIREVDPEGMPVPYLLSGVTDGRHFASLGIQPYGFTPMLLPPDYNFSATIHAADERVTVEAIEFGAEAIYKVIQRFGS